LRRTLCRAGRVWRKGSARAFETHIDIVCTYGFTEENRGPLRVRAYICIPRQGAHYHAEIHLVHGLEVLVVRREHLEGVKVFFL